DAGPDGGVFRRAGGGMGADHRGADADGLRESGFPAWPLVAGAGRHCLRHLWRGAAAGADVGRAGGGLVDRRLGDHFRHRDDRLRVTPEESPRRISSHLSHFPIITSEALITATALSPFFSFSSSTASLVMEAVRITPLPTSI